MITPKYNWLLPQEESLNDTSKLFKKEGLSLLAGQILYRRGVNTQEALRDFLSTDISQLHDPYLLNDMKKAVDRIRQAVETNEKILVYGDYDADGMTAASILKETFEAMGAESLIYLPNRFVDGYGPNKSIYQYYIEQEQVTLIVTVDNGVSGHEAISYANEVGVDVIVTDHHSMPPELPDAYAIIHPEHKGADYPFKYLAGCGVAFKLACALLETIPAELLDLVAIGTIADMVSLTGENRTLVKMGLSVLKDTERLGLLELLNLANVERDSITEETIGFVLAPQLNALGRLDDPNPAIELLTGFDEEETQQIALMIQEKNEERKILVQSIFDEAMQMVDPSKPIQILAKEGWHPGVLGIVAGRILEKISQPVIVLTIDGDTAKGSGRSPDSFNLFEVLNKQGDLFIAFGGHSGAAGMTIAVSQLESLTKAIIDDIYDNNLQSSQKNTLDIDGELDLASIDFPLLKSFDQLAPFGMDNKKPTFLIKDFVVKSVRTMGAGNSHLKLRITQANVDCDVVAFQLGHLAQEFQQLQNIEMVVTLSVNKWNGNTTIQLMLVDARVEGVQLIDIRAKKAYLPSDVPSINETPDSKIVLVADIPEQEETLKDLFIKHDYEAIYFKNTIKNPYYLTGYGTREQFAHLYKTIFQFESFDIRHKLNQLSEYLTIPKILLIKMIQIFEELDFVTISDGVMTVNKTARKRGIAESKIYQELKKTVKFQELMALGSPEEIYYYLRGK
ncbi:single-stranded-DNA-specific exonuclease RecJ [Streptococcus pacificus]|uniref:Single-stranded-DNA-specific exonuclease RecJ n=1 Tax=Streptococcus pacificus TaxID=2740577 RepID=A0ABS0ZHK4_9STRE|nr:single-stranded-DNA-specific exonuclease RecJ [Streptococcus pacificus]MBJ8325457.1 single-stranded-DNA-specific exonuclease RecJ [Streptococcus pacificus]